MLEIDFLCCYGTNSTGAVYCKKAAFTYVFWALFSKTDYGYGMARICPWARDTLE